MSLLSLFDLQCARWLNPLARLQLMDLLYFLDHLIVYKRGLMSKESPHAKMVHVTQSLVFPALFLIIYSFCFAPFWVTFQGSSYGPVYGRQLQVYGNVSNVYLEEYHLDLYYPLLTVLLMCIGILAAAFVQLGFGFLDVCFHKKEKARKIIYMVLASWIFVLHAGVVIAPSAHLLAQAEWCFYLVAAAGSVVSVANLVVAAVELCSVKRKIP